ncbi:hypothetical protein MYCTH_2116734 [Thermothelomyces thermophilus ATCC 42464]|uniref:Zn(2)-C6 fungal-type domain-containing protein n=1 Tax=Thermothelomyces thermophilus (strain ATCC 42464 / BCRC 31852 / DSM 1799) TaxID=573729 RepID=G2Q7N4_THET4|nr:uncharacterized protein MYCTH_2116734 [Thermothelomyces thermophilus ATCC 42464]AEO56092.1 hypothetical protein MYCTH_2116734 [Thermothelomyces thermophilus ATCC 42464]
MESARRVPRPRLYHTKSRTGCTRCRSRRVKCNEARPVCNNCHRHGVSCYYDKDPSKPLQARQPSQPILRPPLSNGDADADARGPPRSGPHASADYWELRAFHHFAVATVGTLPGSHIPSVRQCWAMQVPVLALSYRPLWNQLLALSALHLVASGGDDPGLLACRAASLDATLQSYRPALDQLTPETAEAACFTSILLSVDTFASLQHRPLAGDYEAPMQWLRFTQGARAVFEASTSAAADPASNIVTIIASSNHNRPVPSDRPHRTPDFSYLLQPLPDETQSSSRGVAQAYQETVDRLNLIRAAAEAGEPMLALCRRLMSFACLVPPLFLELVEQKAPRALGILGHFFALSACVKDLWWVGETPVREVSAIRTYLAPELQYLMEWPDWFVTIQGLG